MLDYLKDFEQMIAQGVKYRVFSKTELASVRGSKLGKTKFGISLGFLIDSDEDFIIDYYGYFKRSKGFSERIKEYRKAAGKRQIKAIETIVVHFPSLRIEHIAGLDEALVKNFPRFKDFILEKRGFKNRV